MLSLLLCISLKLFVHSNKMTANELEEEEATMMALGDCLRGIAPALATHRQIGGGLARMALADDCGFVALECYVVGEGLTSRLPLSTITHISRRTIRTQGVSHRAVRFRLYVYTELSSTSDDLGYEFATEELRDELYHSLEGQLIKKTESISLFSLLTPLLNRDFLPPAY